VISTDVLIVGGGPAGAACAWRLKQKNISCMVLDRAAFPRSKPCAGWVTPSVFRSLEITPEDYPHSFTTFKAFQISLRGWKFRLPTHQYAIRRIEFDKWLLDYANTDVKQHDVRVIEKHGDGYVIDGQFQGKYLIGAGGTHCPVRREFFPRNGSGNPGGLIIAKEEEFEYPINDDRCHLWFFEDGLPGYAWYVPKTGGIVNVGIGGSAEKLKRKNISLQSYWEKHIEQLSEIGLIKDHVYDPKGYSYFLRGRSRPVRKDNIFLVGDALGLATKDMGEGIGPAIQSGLLAADAIATRSDFSIKSIPRFSFPSLIKVRS
jgi:flavin-dependent dehydrogenase